MPPGLNLIGQKFGMLTVVRMDRNQHGRVWHCICDCGRLKEKPLTGYELKAGIRNSCGCTLKNKVNRKRTHGQSGTKLYKVWSSMKHRCSNPNDRYYCNYGGRGIRVCGEWMTFEPFRDWALANGYRKGLTLERRDNDGNYEPGNCTWIPKPEQSRNTRHCKLITFQGETKNLTEWARDLGVPYQLLQSRITKAGWDIERALTEPVVPRGRSNARLIEYRGQQKSIAEWARWAGLDPKFLYRRLCSGWSIERALTEPIDPRTAKRKVQEVAGRPVTVARA